MKKFLSFLLTALLLFPTLSSCGRDKGIDITLLEKAEKIGAEAKAPEEEEYTGDWLPETVYSPGDLGDAAGIRYFRIPMADAVSDGMFFTRVCEFQTYPHPAGGSGMGITWLPKIVDLETGEDRALCPDPLCEHLEYSCPYVGLNDAGYAGGAPYVLRAEFGIGKNGEPTQTETVERVDPASGEFTVVAREECDMSAAQTFIMSMAFDGDRLAYVRAVLTTDREARTERRDDTLVFVDLKSGRKTSEVPVPEEWTDFGLDLLDGETLWCYDSVHGHFVTDRTLESMTPAGDGSRFSFNCLDTVTGELFVNVYNDPDAQSGDRTVTLGRLNGEKIEKIPLPRSDLLAVEVTRNWIYYTAYDFVGVGPGRPGYGDAGFDDGGVIYRVPRNDPGAEPEIVFSDGVNFCMKDSSIPWFVLGDCLYFTSWERYEEDGGISFGRNVKAVRVNFAEHTCRYFRYR